MSRTPHSRKEDTHDRILEVASRALRRDGYAGVGVADVMKRAGLTHGGFYAHFASRDAMLAAAVERAGRDSHQAVVRAVERRTARGASRFRALVESYLHPSHLASLDVGCPVAALASDMPRQSSTVRDASAARVEALVALVASALPDAPRETAQMIAGTLVGSLQLARALGDGPQGRVLLAGVRKALVQGHAPVGAEADADADDSVDVDAKAKVKAKAKAKAKAKPKANVDAEANANANANANVDVDAEANVDANSNVDAEVNANEDADADQAAEALRAADDSAASRVPVTGSRGGRRGQADSH